MLKLYHDPISANSRRVWITLIEKGLDFKLIEVNLDGEQFTPAFQAMNPFSHIPVLVDCETTVIESLAILDYLEAQYPIPALMPAAPKDLAIVRMVEMATVNELFPAMNPLIAKLLGLMNDEAAAEQSTQKIHRALTWFEQQLGDRAYFGSETLTLADIVAGTSILFVPMLGMELNHYAKLQAWLDRLVMRSSWKESDQPITPEVLEKVKTRMKARIGQH
ncbi:glutathione S-transferase family protein [Pseudanabaenaceae cyanobacterium LEGE 13415]|nr:glutathione S-transferase family protein [Pseudanabaenaceae cyanobacterium LEGE 13415]